MSGIFAVGFAIGMMALVSGAAGYERYASEGRVGMMLYSIGMQAVGVFAIAFNLAFGFA